MPPKRRPVGSTHSVRYKKFLKRLQAARVQAGLTQAQVAQALRRHQSFVAKCEMGERRIDVLELEQFAKLYKRPLESFLPR